MRNKGNRLDGRREIEMKGDEILKERWGKRRRKRGGIRGG